MVVGIYDDLIGLLLPALWENNKSGLVFKIFHSNHISKIMLNITP